MGTAGYQTGERQSALLASRCGPEMMGAGPYRSRHDHRVVVGGWLRPYSGTYQSLHCRRWRCDPAHAFEFIFGPFGPEPSSPNHETLQALNLPFEMPSDRKFQIVMIFINVAGSDFNFFEVINGM